MCYNYALNTVSVSLEKRFKAVAKSKFSLPVYHSFGFDFPKMPVITSAQPTIIQEFHWGLIPANTKNDFSGEKIKRFTLNVRSESIFEKSSLKNLIFSKRCLIPATGYFEFKHEGKSIIPYHIYLKDIRIFSFAGIWDTYINELNEEINTFSIITKKADEFTAEIHNTKKRMPVIIPPESEGDWLYGIMNKKETENFFKQKIPEMNAYTISKKITDKNYNSNNPEILKEVVYPGKQQKLDF